MQGLIKHQTAKILEDSSEDNETKRESGVEATTSGFDESTDEILNNQCNGNLNLN